MDANLDSLSPSVVREFLTYLREPCPQGRWGSTHHAVTRETRPSTVQTYHRHLRGFVYFCLAEGLLDENPLQNVKTPKVPKDQIQPFTPEQVQLLRDGACRSTNPERDVLIILLLLDTGMRVSDLCGLAAGNPNRGSSEITVTGKGSNKRQLYLE